MTKQKGSLKKIRVKFLDHFRPLPHCVILCYFPIPILVNYVLNPNPSLIPAKFQQMRGLMQQNCLALVNDRFYDTKDIAIHFVPKI